MNVRPTTTARALGLLAVGVLLVGCGSPSDSSGISARLHSPLVGGGWMSQVSAPSGSAAWAVGNSCGPGCGIGSGPERTLILRWDGTAWRRAASPSPGGQAVLNDVSTGPDGTAWTVGASCVSGCGTASEVDKVLILHWNGKAWSRAVSPVGQGDLNSVSVGPGGTAWAVGYSGNGAALILHWNGHSWAQAPTIDGVNSPDLLSVSAGPEGTAWAVGYSCLSGCGSTSESDKALILRWDGSTWSQVPSPTRHRDAILAGVAVAPDGTAWAVGKSCTSSCGTGSEVDKTLILRWDGRAWSQTPSPSPRPVALLAGVAAAPDGTAWAVGFSCAPNCGTASETAKTLILRWNGRAWFQTPSPTPHPITMLAGVAAAPGGTAWTVGVSCVSACSTASQQVRALILRWNGRVWAAASA